MGKGPNLKTRIKQMLQPYEAGLCIHGIQDKLADYSFPARIPAVLAYLVEKGALTVELAECPRDREEHEFYILVDRPPGKESAVKVVVPKRELEKPHGAVSVDEDLSNKSVDELSKEIYSRCKEIQRRIYGGSWKFQG